MCVELDRNLDLRLESLNEIVCFLRSADAGHVLDGDGINAHVNELLTHLYVLLDRVNGRCCVADAALCVLVALLYFVDADFDISEIIERVEDPEDVHAVLGSLTAEETDYIVGIVLVSEDVLTADEHLKGSLLADFLDLAESLPRILVKVSEAGIECSAAPALKRVVTAVVQVLEYALEIRERHTGCDERLLCVTQHCFGDVNFHMKSRSLI